jgi:hypothetical protein
MSKSKNRTVINKYNFYFGPRPLDYTNEYKYLGIIFDNKGKIRIAAENVADETRKAYFVLKSKLPYSNFISVEKWMKLYDSLSSPILTYGTEVWISDFKLNFDSIDKLPFEKVQNMIIKDMGVHRKAPNLAVRNELGIYPLCIKSYELMFKFYARLADMESKNETKFKLLKSAFVEDKKLYLRKSTCLVQPLHQLKGLLNLQSLDISFLEFKLAIENYLRNKVLDQLEHIKSSNEGKLRFYSNICSSFDL